MSCVYVHNTISVVHGDHTQTLVQHINTNILSLLIHSTYICVTLILHTYVSSIKLLL